MKRRDITLVYCDTCTRMHRYVCMLCMCVRVCVRVCVCACVCVCMRIMCLWMDGHACVSHVHSAGVYAYAYM